MIFPVQIAVLAIPAGAETVYFGIPDSPPFTAMDGEDKEFYGNLTLRLLSETALKNYTVEHLNGNYARIFAEMENRPDICLLSAFRTPERERKFAFSSVPDLVSYSPVLIVNKDIWEHLGQPHKVSIRKLLEDRALVLGIANGRSYGNTLDEVIAANKDAVMEYSQVNIGTHLVFLTGVGRVQATLAYPEELFLTEGEYDKFKSDTVRAVLVEEYETFSKFYTVCSKSDTGDQVLKLLDGTLSQDSTKKKVSGYYERWLPVELLEDHRRAVAEDW